MSTYSNCLVLDNMHYQSFKGISNLFIRGKISHDVYCAQDIPIVIITMLETSGKYCCWKFMNLLENHLLNGVLFSLLFFPHNIAQSIFDYILIKSYFH